MFVPLKRVWAIEAMIMKEATPLIRGLIIRQQHSLMVETGGTYLSAREAFGNIQPDVYEQGGAVDEEAYLYIKHIIDQMEQ